MSEQPKKILIVEDDEMIRKPYADELRDKGFSVATATNGQEGLETALREKPDLILLDIVMPVMNGMDMMKKLMADDWGRKVPIILLTNLSANENIIKGVITDEPLYFLVKSDWSIKDVLEQIKKILI